MIKSPDGKERKDGKQEKDKERKDRKTAAVTGMRWDNRQKVGNTRRRGEQKLM